MPFQQIRYDKDIHIGLVLIKKISISLEAFDHQYF